MLLHTDNSFDLLFKHLIFAGLICQVFRKKGHHSFAMRFIGIFYKWKQVFDLDINHFEISIARGILRIRVKDLYIDCTLNSGKIFVHLLIYIIFILLQHDSMLYLWVLNILKFTLNPHMYHTYIFNCPDYDTNNKSTLNQCAFKMYNDLYL